MKKIDHHLKIKMLWQTKLGKTSIYDLNQSEERVEEEDE